MRAQVKILRRLVVVGVALLVPALGLADAPAKQYKPYLSNDPFVQDDFTGLQWERDSSPAKAIFAASACSTRNPRLNANFRLPTLRELATLLDNQPRKTIYEGASKDLHVDQSAFPRSNPDVYWTLTQAPSGDVFVIDFSSGEIRTMAPTATAFVRCVNPT